ncbi:MAG: phosphoribosylformylglycinamidine synthase I [Planctomycetota bacterium]
MSARRAPRGGVRAIVLRSAGTNCDGETVLALRAAGAEVDLVHLNALARDPARLAAAAILALPGGFSYGDYVAAGRVFGLEIRHRLLDPLHRFVADGGFVLGVCNGFQILVELGMFEVPGASAAARGIALTDNESNRFECRWVTLRAEACACPWLVAGELMPVPVAHAEGRFVVRDAETLARLRANGQIALTYVAPDGGPAAYPDLPNGSTAAIAGLCDPSGRVLGLMPHPERNLMPWNHPQWTRRPPRAEGEGLSFYRRLVECAARGAPSAARTSSRR